MKEGLSSFLPHLPGKACSIGGICLIELSLLEFNTDRNIYCLILAFGNIFYFA